MRFDYLFITTYLCGAQSCPCTFLSFKLHVLELSHNIVSVVFTYPWLFKSLFRAETKMKLLFWQLKELQTRQATLLTLQRDAEMRLAEAEEEVQ